VPKTPHDLGEREQATTPAGEMAVTTPDISSSAGQLRIIISQLETSIRETRADIRDLKDHRHADFRWHITILGGGFLLLAGMFIAGYLRLEDRIDPLTKSSIRIETKMDDLLARIPPVPTPPPRISK